MLHEAFNFSCHKSAYAVKTIVLHYIPKARKVRFVSAGVKPAALLSRRNRLLGRLLNRCPVNDFRRLILRLPVTLTRLANPLCVFCLGIINLAMVNNSNKIKDQLL